MVASKDGQPFISGDLNLAIATTYLLENKITHDSKTPKAKNSNEANHVVFYDQMKIAKSCKKIDLKKLGYSCNDLEGQKLKFVHTIK